MSQESIYEQFETLAANGDRCRVEFVRAGVLAQGDRPELFFFRVNGEEAVVGVSGDSLRRFERGRSCLSREQKIDITGLWLKRQIEAGMPLDSKHLYIRDHELANLAGELHNVE